MSAEPVCLCGEKLEGRDDDFGLVARCPRCGLEYAEGKPSPNSELLVIGGGPAELSLRAVASFLYGLCFFLGFLSGIPAILIGDRARREIGQSGGRLRGRGFAWAGIVLGVLGCLYTFVILHAFRSPRSEARRLQCASTLKQMSQAIHDYQAAYECFPPAAIVDDRGKPLLSWRVAILPYVEGSESLYTKFHLDEPWDSPHNFTLIDQMPACYACLSDESPEQGMTNYQAMIGPGAAFRPDGRPLKESDFPDGLSTTIFVGETTRKVFWTKPEDLSVISPEPFRGLGSDHGRHYGGFNVLFGDGRALFLSDTTKPDLFDAFLTRDGREVTPPDVSW